MTTHVYGNGTNSTSGSNTITHFYDRAGINAANRVNVFQQFASKKSMPTRYGKDFKISMFLHMYDTDQPGQGNFESQGYRTARDHASVISSTAGAALSEGSGPANKVKLEKVTFSTSLARYGQMIEYTDEVDLFSEDVMQVRYREELAELANAVHEDLIMLDMLGTTTVMCSGTATAEGEVGQDVVDADGLDDDFAVASYDLIRKSVRKLVRNRGQKNTTVITGSIKVDTQTVARSYYAIIGADVKSDLEEAMREDGEYAYVPVHQYAAAGKIAEGEVGSMHEVRFIEAEGMPVYRGKGANAPSGYKGRLQTTGNKFDVFPILFPTQDSFATVGLKGRDKIKFLSSAPTNINNENPFGTKGFFSYNFFYAGLITRPECMLKVLVAASK